MIIPICRTCLYLFTINTKRYHVQIKNSEIITDVAKRSLRLLPEEFSVSKLPHENMAFSNLKDPFFLSSSHGEVTLITETNRTPKVPDREDGWRAIRIEGAIPFDESGVLFKLLKPFADKGVSVLAIATHSTDYVFFKENALSEVKKALSSKYHLIESSSVTTNTKNEK